MKIIAKGGHIITITVSLLVILTSITRSNNDINYSKYLNRNENYIIKKRIQALILNYKT